MTSTEQSAPLLFLDEEPPIKSRLTAHRILAASRTMLSSVQTFNRPAANKTLRRVCYILTPTIIRSHYLGERSPPPKLHRTSWVDGLRGVGCILVFNTHFLFAFNDSAVRAYGTDDKHRSFAQLPFIRWLYSSGLGIMIFFLVAGYVLSMKPLRLMRNNDAASREKLLQSLSSSAFRRFFRLYIPSVFSMLMIAIFAYLGFYEKLRPYIGNRIYFQGVSREPQVKRFPTLAGQLQLWLQEVNEIMSVWNFKTFYPTHDHHLWSIRDQYRGSMYLFAALLTLSRTREFARLIFLVILDCYLLCWGMWQIALFFLGATISQVDIMRQPDGPSAHVSLPEKEKPSYAYSLPSQISSHVGITLTFPRQWNPQLGNAVWFSCFTLAFYLMSAPRFDYQLALGYQTLSQLIPGFYLHKETLMPMTGATMLMFCFTYCTPSSVCYKFLTNGFALYLGKIAFALYLVHGPMLHLFGYMFPHIIWHFTGNSSTVMYGFGLLVGWAMNLVLVLWVADIYTREVDGKTVQFVRWIETQCCLKG